METLVQISMWMIAITCCTFSLAFIAFVINGVIWSIRQPYVERRLEKSKAELKARFEQQSFEDFHEDWMANMKRLVGEDGIKIYRE